MKYAVTSDIPGNKIRLELGDRILINPGSRTGWPTGWRWEGERDG
ncbi:MAG: hypothetical protein P9M08_09340 [Candidatus Erginobacter occultus]|nr:hypothetical protein [Candidatus Erginobacter occultus]